MNFLTTLALPLAALASTAHADLLVVDAAQGPGSSFNTIQAAVTAASNGDTILVRPGVAYQGFSVSGKSLSILAEYKTYFTLDKDTEVEVRDLAADQIVVIRGVRDNNSTTIGSGSQWRLQDCLGTVWIEDCLLDVKGPQGQFVDPSHKIDAENVDRLFVVRSILFGGNGKGSSIIGGTGSSGLDAQSCGDVVVLDSELRGGLGGFGSGLDFALGGAGGSALTAHDCDSVFLSGCRLFGGDGGDSLSEGCDWGGDGGDGLHLTSGSAVPTSPTVLRDCDAFPGIGGINLDEFCPLGQGLPGELFTGDAGAVTVEAGEARSLSAPTPVREGEVLRFRLEGAPGDLGFLVFGSQESVTAIPGLGGLLLVDAVLPLLFTGVVGTETLVYPLTIPNLPPGVDVRALPVQGLFASAAAEVVLGSVTHITLLDDSL